MKRLLLIIALVLLGVLFLVEQSERWTYSLWRALDRVPEAEALERAGDTRGVKVVGIDGTPQGIEGLKSGKLYGTVQCDSDEYAEVIFEIAAAEALGQNVQEKVELEEGTYYQCSQKALTVADLP